MYPSESGLKELVNFSVSSWGIQVARRNPLPDQSIAKEPPLNSRMSGDGSANGVTSAIQDIVQRACAVSASEGSGDLTSSGVHLGRGPGVRVDGLGLLPLPMNAHLFSALQAPRGGDADLVIDPSHLRFDNPQWQGCVPAQFIDAVARDCGMPMGATCAASLRGLFVAGPGGGLAHRISTHTQAGQPATLVIVLPSEWTGGVLTVRHGPVVCEYAACEEVRYGGSLQHIAFFAGCELGETPITSGYRSALVYSLLLQSPSAALVPFSAPAWPGDVGRLQTLLRSWCEQLLTAEANEWSLQATPQRILVSISSEGDGVQPGTLFGSAKALADMARFALDGNPELGGYLARLAITERCSAVSLGRRYASEPARDMSTYRWSVVGTGWVLSDKVDLRGGTQLGALGQEALDIAAGGYPRNTALMPRAADFSLSATCSPASFVLDDDNGAVATGTRLFFRTVLVLGLRHDAWQELAAVVGVDAALDRLMTEMREADSGADSAAEGNKRARLTGPQASPSTATSRLRDAFLSCGPLAVAASLFGLFSRQHRAHGLGPDPPRFPPALLRVIAASPPRSVSDASPLLCRIFRDFAPDVVTRHHDYVAAAITATQGDRSPITVLCEVLRSARLTLPGSLCSCALQLAREFLETTGAPAGALDTPIAGAKRRRRYSFDARGSPDAPSGQAAFTRAWLKDAGQTLLCTIASAFVSRDDFCEEARDLVQLVLLHGRAAEVESFVRARLHIILGRRDALAVMFEPRDPAIASAIESAIMEGMPQLAKMPKGSAMLLSLAWLLCRQSAEASLPSPPSKAVTAPDPSSQSASLAGQSAAFVQGTPSEPHESTALSLVASHVNPCVLSYSVVVTPTTVSNELAERLLQSIALAWPQARMQDGQAARSAGALLALLVSRSGSDNAAVFVKERLGLIVGSPSGSKVLMNALIPVDASASAPVALWNAVLAGVAAVTVQLAPLSYDERYYMRQASQAVAIVDLTSVAAFVLLLASEVEKEEAAPSPHRSWSPRPHYSRVLRAFIDEWPAASVTDHPAALDVLRACVCVRDTAAATALLPHLPSKLLLADLLDLPSSAASTPRHSCLLIGAIESLGWSPFGEALGKAMSVALISGLPSARRYATFDLAAAVSFASRLHTTFMSSDTATASGELTADANAVVTPVHRAIMEVAVGVNRISVAALSVAELSSVALFLQGVQHLHPAGMLAAWVDFVASAPGSAIYPVTSVVGFAEATLSGAARPAGQVPRSCIALLLGALVSSETARLAKPVLPLRWERSAVCSSECHQNPDGQSSCGRLTEFLEDPEQQAATFYFTNMQKLRHVVSTFKRNTVCRAVVNDRELELQKLPDAGAAEVRVAAVARYAHACATLRRLEGLLETSCADQAAAGVAAPAAAGASRRTFAPESGAAGVSRRTSAQASGAAGARRAGVFVDSDEDA